MQEKLSQHQLEDIRQSLELVYDRKFGEDETLEFAERLFALYDELKRDNSGE